MVGALVCLRCVALVGFAVGMGVGTLGVGVCCELLQVHVGTIKGDTGMAWPEQRIHDITVCMGVSCDASTFPCVVGSVRAGVWSLIVFMTLSEEQSMGA